MRHPRIYAALKAFGFSAFKAAEIMLDAERGDKYALSVVRLSAGATRKAK
jgi:hypothetical protein